MSTVALPVAEPSYDVVGRYCQDEVNGFTDETIERMLAEVDPATAARVLDAMAGDGNLTARLGAFCAQRGLRRPDLAVLEFSAVQCEFARAQLAPLAAQVIHGDVLTMRDLDTDQPLPEAAFDRVMIKSANHELPLARQLELYQGVHRVLRPGGRFVNLGFLFDDPLERDEFREIARVKDTLAGLKMAAAQRHFLTREEFYGRLSAAGFLDVVAAHAVDYRIHSAVVARHYFNKPGLETADAEFQAGQARALALRKRSRLVFDREFSLMIIPGEITVARRATAAEQNARTYRQYPYDFLRHMACHAELLARAATWIPRGAAVLDLACGPGLLGERLLDAGVRYHGIDLDAEHIRICRERYGARAGFAFEVGDMNTVDLGEARYDVVAILNALYQPGVQMELVLKKAVAALVPGGRILVSGPTSAESYRKVEPQIRAQLARDGHLAGNEERLAAVARANAALLTARGNYLPGATMAQLLETCGCRRLDLDEAGIYYGQGYLVVAQK